MKRVRVLVGLAVIGALAALGFLYSGWYPIGADVPHNHLTYWALETMREKSIARASADLVVPPLDDPQMLMAGGADYNDMCAGCHLKPGKTRSDMSLGLYPTPPNLSVTPTPGASMPKDLVKASAARQFWIIKHGIKASAMAAWGPTHDDARIWAMVAFLQRLPALTPDQYQILTAREDGASMDHDAMDMSTMADTAPAPAPAAADKGNAPTATAVPAAGSPSALADPTATVEQFQKALQAGNTQAAAALLDPDVKIFESGDVEQTRQEYASHHLGADAAFLKTATVALKARSGDAIGDLAWVGSESRLTANENGKAIDLASTETMVLKKTPEGWRIVHIHWSSHPTRKP